jgi:hypothetical protein
MFGRKASTLTMQASIRITVHAGISHLLFSMVGGKVVKIAIQLVKSYVFTSQYRLYVLNRLQNSKIGKIGSKSGKIVKIG